MKNQKLCSKCDCEVTEYADEDYQLCTLCDWREQERRYERAMASESPSLWEQQQEARKLK